MDFFYKEAKSKNIFFFGGGGGDREWRWRGLE